MSGGRLWCLPQPKNILERVFNYYFKKLPNHPYHKQSILKSRITQWFGWKGIKDHLIPTPCHEQGHQVYFEILFHVIPAPQHLGATYSATPQCICFPLHSPHSSSHMAPKLSPGMSNFHQPPPRVLLVDENLGFGEFKTTSLHTRRWLFLPRISKAS